MTGKRKVWIVAILLLALVIVNWSLGAWNKKQDERESKEAEAAKIYLVDAEDITAYSYNNGESEMSFTRTDDGWCYDEDTEIPMNQDTIQSTADSIAGMTAVRQLDEPDELADYGLDSPMYTIAYKDSAGSESAIYIGNGAGENYYATVGDTGKVYTISSDFLNLMQFELAGLVQYDTVPSIGSGNLKQVTVTDSEEESVYKEDDELAELAGGFGTIALTDCADYHVAENDLPEYGLDEEHRTTVTAEYTDNASGEDEKFLLYVGSLDDSGENRYVTVKDSAMVYKVSDAIVRNLMTVDEGEE
ncbi:MAG: DUF4340 domain-containing protein [Eubacteriales bacterium]|nr:DUF4340 domain-containing protein [Eubacteriales bacterium]